MKNPSARWWASGAALGALGLAVLVTTQRTSTSATRSDPPPAQGLSLAELGQRIFFDPALSEPGGTSCATCHDPAHGYAGNNGSALGVARGSRAGHFARRATPSVLYLKFVHPRHFHWEEDAPLPDARGGLFWDGRVDSIAALFRQPLLNPDEMGNTDPAQVAARLRAAPYAALLGRVGPLDSPDAALATAGKAVEAFLLGEEMSPFTSKYDDVIRKRAAFTPLEARGLAVFKDRGRGNCSGCHKLNDAVPVPQRSLFTDHGFESIGVPRNRRLPGNQDPTRFDLGLCTGPDPTGHLGDARFCGSFRTPSLRNVALRPSFMHNGVFTSLRDAVAFYATRDTDPSRWYHGRPFDDLPARYRAGVNVTSVPFNQRRGQRPRLDEADVDALVAFLGTLTDRHLPVP